MSNPHTPGTPEHAAWSEGHRRAVAEALDDLHQLLDDVRSAVFVATAQQYVEKLLARKERE